MKLVRQLSQDKFSLRIAKVISSASTCDIVKCGIAVVDNFCELVSVKFTNKIGECTKHGICTLCKHRREKIDVYCGCESLHNKVREVLLDPIVRINNGTTIYIYGCNCTDGQIVTIVPDLITNAMLRSSGIKHIYSAFSDYEMVIDNRNEIEDNKIVHDIQWQR